MLARTQTARKNAPCILFIDEFDGVGQARAEAGQGSEEGVHTINQVGKPLEPCLALFFSRSTDTGSCVLLSSCT